MKHKTTIIAAIVLLGVLSGGFFVIRSSPKTQPQPSSTKKLNLDLPDVNPAVVVNLQKTADGKSVVLTITHIPEGTTSIEYELSYNTEEGLPKGVLGEIELHGNTQVERDILLGTCSAGGRCTYDTGVTQAKVVLIFHHPNGNSKFVKEYPLQ